MIGEDGLIGEAFSDSVNKINSGYRGSFSLRNERGGPGSAVPSGREGGQPSHGNGARESNVRPARECRRPMSKGEADRRGADAALSPASSSSSSSSCWGWIPSLLSLPRNSFLPPSRLKKIKNKKFCNKSKKLNFKLTIEG